MRLNADFSRLALVVPREEDWVQSPQTGVDRLMLDRIGDEVARATSLVRYAAGSAFSAHEHALGEEFLVLEGVFSDETGDYPAGTYVRNPPGSRHAPASRDGCRILVKLRQFDPGDLARVVIDTRDERLWQRLSADEERLALHRYGDEVVEMRRLADGAETEIDARPGGAELLVVRGTLGYDGRALPAESWLRLPAGRAAALEATAPALIWLKRGHLPAAS